MDTKSEFEKSLAKCYRALQLILDKKTLAIPRNYDVWYSYVTGEPTPLVEAVDSLISANGTVDQGDLDDLYDRFLCPIGKLAASEEIGTMICGEVDIMATRLANASARTREYRESLKDTSGQLSGSIDTQTLKRLVASMIHSTANMVKHSETLERDLADARTQVMVLNEALANLKAETQTDSLTGLANRKKFDRDLIACMKQATITGAELCLLIGDVDHFKKFNDMYGHQVGDDVLRQVAGVLCANVRNRELVSRYGGEEFAIILPKTSLQGSVTIATRICSTLASTKISARNDGAKLNRITMSFGIARYRVGDTIETFVKRADAGLYAAKKAGRNCVKTEAEATPRDIHGSAVA